MRIGLDFDNTIVGYGEVFRTAARAAGLIPERFDGGKADVKSYLFARSGGDAEWMRLQGKVYGVLMGQAVMAEGADSFLRKAREAGADVFIVSHKTVHGHFDRHVNLREVARDWLESRGFFSKEGYGIQPGNVYFEDSRVAKVARVAALKLDVFVDDLVEVFEEAGFPATTRRILFADVAPAVGFSLQICPDWTAIRHAVFGP